MRRSLTVGLAVALLLPMSVALARAEPPLEGESLAPPADRAPRAFVAVAPYRYDDLLWENDLTAHRIYGRALQAAEPPSGSGVDAWGKKVPWPFMERQLKSGDQHRFHGEGLDFYNVGTSRGMGGLGVWYDDKLWVSRNYVRAKVLKNGPDEARFEVSYAPWPVDVVRKVWERRRFSLLTGTHFTRMTSTIGSDKHGPLLVGIGLSKRATSDRAAELTVDRRSGRLSAWSAGDARQGAMGTAILVDPRMIAEVKEDADNYLVILKVTPGRPFVYYAGAAWDGGPDIHSRTEWDAYVARQTPDFRP